MGPETWIPVLVAFAGGSTLPKVVEVIGDRRAGRTESRRSEIDRMAKQLRDARRRERIAVEWGHKNAVIAIRAGVSDDRLPVLNFRDDPEEVI